MKVGEDEGNGRLALVFWDVACSAVIVLLLRVRQRLFARDEVWAVGDLIQLTIKYSSFCQPSESFREFVHVNEVKLGEGQLAWHLLVVSRFLWHIQIVRENVLQRWRFAVDCLENFMELVQTIEGRNEHNEVACSWSSIESNVSDRSAVATSDIKDLKCSTL